MLPRSYYNNDYYGLKVYYRFESRAQGRAVHLSIYDEWTNPEKPKKAVERVLFVPKAMLNLDDNAIVYQLIPKFLKKAFPFPFSKKTTAQDEKLRNQLFPFLPFGVICICDIEAITDSEQLSTQTAKSFQISMDWLKEKFGSLRIDEVIPKTVAKCFPYEQPAKTASIIWAIRKFYNYETFFVPSIINPWKNYSPDLYNVKRSSGKQSMKINSLSDEAFTDVVESCMLNISTGKDFNYFAALLFFTTPLEVNEICALNKTDFELLTEYCDCMVVNIDKTYSKSEHSRNYALHYIEQSYQKRRLPMPSIVRTAFAFLDFTPNEYLIHHKKNIHRRCPGDEFEEFIKTILKSSAYSARNDKPLLDNPKNVQALIKRSVKVKLEQCGFEDDELRYLQGNRPLTTAGIHYCDFTAEGELNRLALLQDRWINLLNLDFTNKYPKMNKRERYSYASPGDYLQARSTPEKALSLSAKITIDSLTRETTTTPVISFRLSSLCGFYVVLKPVEEGN